MALVPGIPQPMEYPMEFRAEPRQIPAGRDVTFDFRVLDPRNGKPVKQFEIIHEKLFHAFVVSEDLQFFRHAHPTLAADGMFQLPIVFPKPGMYRVLGDFYPAGATPQLNARTVFVPGDSPAPVQLTRDYSPKAGENMRVSMETIPEQAIAGNRTQLRFRFDPGEGLEQYLGAWAHMLAASNDLIDMIHQHPYRIDEGPMVEFEMVFPRPLVYRVWVQFQRLGVVNTVQFDVPVTLSE